MCCVPCRGRAGRRSLNEPIKPLPADGQASERPAQQDTPRSPLSLIVRIVAGAALLAIVVWYVEPKALWAQLRRADPWLFALATVVAILGNLLSVTRWA